MAHPQKRALLIGLTSIALAWLVAWSGFALARNARMTADKLNAYLQRVNLARLHGADREQALHELIAKVNALDADERRAVRSQGNLARLFEQMTEEERAQYIDGTMPRHFKQMIAAFEKLPEEKRKKAVDDAVRRLRQESAEAAMSDGVTNRSPVLSEDLQKRIVRAGLKTYYTDSSSQTKAELAPFLEELQRSMERGVAFRGH